MARAIHRWPGSTVGPEQMRWGGINSKGSLHESQEEGVVCKRNEITEVDALSCSLLNCLLNSRFAVVLLHFSDFGSAHDDVESVWFELWVIGRLADGTPGWLVFLVSDGVVSNMGIS